jgi:hypothetical protein
MLLTKTIHLELPNPSEHAYAREALQRITEALKCGYTHFIHKPGCLPAEICQETMQYIESIAYPQTIEEPAMIGDWQAELDMNS